MSWLLVGGLDVTCVECGRTRVIPRRGGADYLQVGDRNVMEQSALRAARGDGDSDLFFLEAVCPACAAERLAGHRQAIYRALRDIVARRDAWLQAFRQAGRARFREETLATLDHEEGVSWLRRYFPDDMNRLAADPQCRHTNYFASRRKKFRRSAVAYINKAGVLVSDGLKAWLTKEMDQLQPLREELGRLEQDVMKVMRSPDEVWVLLDERDTSREGICLNPFIVYEKSVFVAEEGADALLYFAFRVKPGDLVAECREALLHPVRDWWQFLEDAVFMEGMSARVRSMVDALVWPMAG